MTAAPFTYAEVGATTGALPAGYRHIRRSVEVRCPFEEVVDDLVHWRVHERSGIRVAASGPAVDPDATVTMRLGPLRVPCRIVYVVGERDRAGFAYGTLPGHPESGEELFLVERRNDGAALFSVTAFSRPATMLARLGGPVARAIQDRITERYLRAAARR